jgi:hypothetical protein
MCSVDLLHRLMHGVQRVDVRQMGQVGQTSATREEVMMLALNMLVISSAFVRPEQRQAMLVVVDVVDVVEMRESCAGRGPRHVVTDSGERGRVHAQPAPRAVLFSNVLFPGPSTSSSSSAAFPRKVQLT